MKRELYTTITLDQTTKQLLSCQKGTLSFNYYINSMLNYFEVNGINPTKMAKGGNGAQVLQSIEQLKKMLRAIERDKIDYLYENITNGNSIKFNNSNASKEQTAAYNELKTKYENAINELQQLKNNSSEKLYTKEDLLKAKREGAEEVNYIIPYYFSEENCKIMFTRANYGKGDYLISRAFLDKFIEKGNDIIKNIK